ncbi:glycosyltransferase [Paenibacillus chitinolyticus]|uniref:glycosyltransferase n=1 Tax=Paenibacillus chitinolyticus TaxID=79263 RepID=UPI003CFE5F76
MKVLLVTSNWAETYGHAVRSMAAAEQLTAAGHEVAVLAPASFRHLFPDGVRFYESVPKPAYIENKLPFFGYHTYEDLIFVSGHADDFHLIDTIERERATIRDFQADLVFADMQFTIAVSAYTEGVRLASIVNWPLHPAHNIELEDLHPGRKLILRRVRNIWNRMLRKYGMPPVEHVCRTLFDHCQLLLVPSCKELEPELLRYEPEAEIVGQLVPSAFKEEPAWFKQWKQTCKEPLVFVYLSSLPFGINSRSTFEMMYSVFERNPVRAVFAIGKYNSAFLDHPLKSREERIRFEPFVPSETIMAHSSLCITPGSNSMMVSAMRHHVPGLLFPDTYERNFNAFCMERAGLGIVCGEDDLGRERFESLLHEGLAGKCTEISLRIQKQLTDLEQTPRLVRLLESAARGGVTS